MGKIKGVSVVLHARAIKEYDPLGNPIYEYTDVTVNNVLWNVSSVDDLIDTSRLEGTQELYTLAIPKSDANTWLENTVTFNGKTYHCYAESEGIEDLIPLEWNKKVLVERYDG